MNQPVKARPGPADVRDAAKPRGARRRRSLFPNTVVLLLAIIALLLFIGVMGDARRTRNALHQADIYAAGYAERTGHTRVLPLNLEPESLASAEPKLMDFAWLPTDQVLALRQTDQPVLAAWSEPVLKFFGRDGRAVVVFDAGEFDVRWLNAAEFAQTQAAQGELVKILQASGDRH